MGEQYIRFQKNVQLHKSIHASREPNLMNLHEYQAKALFSAFGMPVPRSRVVQNREAAIEAAEALGGYRWVVKAQVHAGGRGKAGGVQLVDSVEAVGEVADKLLDTNLITFQTTEEGQPVNQILVEEISDIQNELYLGVVIDRASQCIVFMASTEGGMDIESVAEKTPDKIHKIMINPITGIMPWQARQLAFALDLSGDAFKDFSNLLKGLYRLFIGKDLSLVEINPLVITSENRLICLDGKINIDSNALFRQPDLLDLRDTTQEDERELRAADNDLSYVALDGTIGCLVNGAGLAMATMDIIKYYDGSPANFLDVGGTATAKRVTEAFKIITSEKQVKGILVNIFGGIVRCDLIAEGIIEAAKTVNLNIPVVVRLEGNMAKEGMELLNNTELELTVASNLADAAQKIVSLSK